MSDPTPGAPAVVPEEEARELLVVAQEMVRALDDLREEMAGTKKYGRRNRRLIRWIAVSLAVDLLLSIGLGAAIARANTASKRAERAASAQVVACRAGNEARALQTDLWNTILAFPPVAGEAAPSAEESAQRERRVADFRRYIKTAFAPQECK